ncbi:citramalate synthase, partial [Streptomyces sp. SID7803]|nr:citramalate synthase [Streptomyces sp. SID7803]
TRPRRPDHSSDRSQTSHDHQGQAHRRQLHVFDTTLRDGSQREGINLTVADKLTIARHLDEFGVGSSRAAGRAPTPATPSSSPVPARRSSSGTPSWSPSARPAGRAVRRRRIPQVKALLESGAPGDHAGRQVPRPPRELALRTTLEENLEMVRDTVSHLREQAAGSSSTASTSSTDTGPTPEYAKAVVKAAADAGADVVILCDTNGGMLPAQIQAVVSTVIADTGAGS